jgi:hypothetical protein
MTEDQGARVEQDRPPAAEMIGELNHEAPARPRKQRTAAPAAADVPAAAAAPAPCADCQDKQGSLEERLTAIESAHRALAKGFVTLVVAAVTVYVLASRESKAGGE